MHSIVSQGINLALLGMGTVFVFLTLLIFATHLMSYLLNRFLIPDADLNISSESKSTSTKTPEHTVAIITAAIQEHRRIESQRRG